jgi:hypothetical protein
LNRLKYILSLACLVWLNNPSLAQLSPGNLAEPHKHLEGLSNCTKCHTLGNKIQDQKCLDCHKEISALIGQNRGYHASNEVKSKTCYDCHSDHHGRKFDMIRFKPEEFNHDLAGYPLEGRHEVVDCKACHKPDFIADEDLKKRENTFLGLEQNCLSCHEDYHQETLGDDCARCHNIEGFRPAPGFDHRQAEFTLKGAHREVDCSSCHQITVRQGREFQKFTDIDFSGCVSCHTDVHEGKFGVNCAQCHNEQSFRAVNITKGFNHNLTDYPLEHMHTVVSCKACHTSGNYAAPINFSQCKNCHEDYHKGEFGPFVNSPDCNACHTLERPFSYTTYGLDEHQSSDFPLRGAHAATPCFECHQKEERWSFDLPNNGCTVCHEDIHAGFIDDRFYPGQDCGRCHTADNWADIGFDHDETGWVLTGRHALVECRDCHFGTADSEKGYLQNFSVITGACMKCHENVHGDQFMENGMADCAGCHSAAFDWKADRFSHDQTTFPLDGRHAIIECGQCHRPETNEEGKTIVEYKIKNFQCIDCHM